MFSSSAIGLLPVEATRLGGLHLGALSRSRFLS
jgi:hypothetical protein